MKRFLLWCLFLSFFFLVHRANAKETPTKQPQLRLPLPAAQAPSSPSQSDIEMADGKMRGCLSVVGDKNKDPGAYWNAVKKCCDNNMLLAAFSKKNGTRYKDLCTQAEGAIAGLAAQTATTPVPPRQSAVPVPVQQAPSPAQGVDALRAQMTAGAGTPPAASAAAQNGLGQCIDQVVAAGQKEEEKALGVAVCCEGFEKEAVARTECVTLKAQNGWAGFHQQFQQQFGGDAQACFDKQNDRRKCCEMFSSAQHGGAASVCKTILADGHSVVVSRTDSGAGHVSVPPAVAVQIDCSRPPPNTGPRCVDVAYAHAVKCTPDKVKNTQEILRQVYGHCNVPLPAGSLGIAPPVVPVVAQKSKRANVNPHPDYGSVRECIRDLQENVQGGDQLPVDDPTTNEWCRSEVDKRFESRKVYLDFYAGTMFGGLVGKNPTVSGLLGGAIGFRVSGNFNGILLCSIDLGGEVNSDFNYNLACGAGFEWRKPHSHLSLRLLAGGGGGGIPKKDDSLVREGERYSSQWQAFVRPALLLHFDESWVKSTYLIIELPLGVGSHSGGVVTHRATLDQDGRVKAPAMYEDLSSRTTFWGGVLVAVGRRF